MALPFPEQTLSAVRESMLAASLLWKSSIESPLDSSDRTELAIHGIEALTWTIGGLDYDGNPITGAPSIDTPRALARPEIILAIIDALDEIVSEYVDAGYKLAADESDLAQWQADVFAFRDAAGEGGLTAWQGAVLPLLYGSRLIGGAWVDGPPAAMMALSLASRMRWTAENIGFGAAALLALEKWAVRLVERAKEIGSAVAGAVSGWVWAAAIAAGVFVAYKVMR